MESEAHEITEIPSDAEPMVDAQSLPGIIAELGNLRPGAIITEEGVARLFKRHTVSVKRAVSRGELPPPTRLFGVNVWTVGSLIRYIESRLEEAAQDVKRVAKLAPRGASLRRK